MFLPSCRRLLVIRSTSDAEACRPAAFGSTDRVPYNRGQTCTEPASAQAHIITGGVCVRLPARGLHDSWHQLAEIVCDLRARLVAAESCNEAPVGSHYIQDGAVIDRVVVRPWAGAVLNVVNAIFLGHLGDLLQRTGQADQAWGEGRHVLLHN